MPRPKKITEPEEPKVEEKKNIIGRPSLELERHRYFYVTYRYIHLNVERPAGLCFETQFNRHFSIQDILPCI